jgi:hypothetical protein
MENGEELKKVTMKRRKEQANKDVRIEGGI